jgi:hypothetical protein
MSDTPGFVPLASVVHSFLNATGIYSKVNYKRFLRIVAENYSDININGTALFKTANIVVGATNTIPWPSDYIDYVRIGVGFAGKIFTLTKNEAIVGVDAISCGEDVVDADLSNQIETDWYSHYTASGGKNFMYYRSDKETRRIIFDGDGIGRTIILQYISSGVSVDGETMIPASMLKMLRKYLHWVLMDYDMTNKYPQSKIEAARRDFYLFKEEYERLDTSFTADEFIDALRQSYSQGIKS